MRPILLTGFDLTLDEVLAVARGGALVEIDPAALETMGRARAVADRAIAEGTAAYGVTTGVWLTEPSSRCSTRRTTTAPPAIANSVVW